MAYQVTARKWRPRRFEEVVGQEHITGTLTNALRTGRLAQCYLFCGPRGVGKTTTARILAKALNCAGPDGANPCDQCPSCVSIAAGTSLDVLEIDGASNNSVDDVRELREAVRYVPTQGSHKIYIIDEVHMLSTAAFNALLKTLEEPPERVVFVFATTEVQEVPDTILSRCQRFNFRRIPTGEIAAHLSRIAQAEGIAADEAALYLLARRADGALRDGQSLMDQVASYSAEAVTEETVREVLGLVDQTVFFDLSAAISAGDGARILDLIATVVDEGGDIEELTRGYLEHAGHLLFTKVQGDAAKLEAADAERARYEELSDAFAEEDLLRILHDLMELEQALRRSLQPRFRIEMTLVRLSRMGRAVDIGRLLARLEALEAGGAAVAPAPVVTSRVKSAQRVPQQAARPVQEPHEAHPGAADSSGPPGPPPAQPPPTEAPPPTEPPPDMEPMPGPGAARRAGAPSGQEAPPAPAPPAAAPAGAPSGGEQVQSGGGLTLDRVQGEWGRVIAEIRKTQPTVGVFLQEGALQSLEGGVLTVAYSPENRFHMGQVMKSRENAEHVIAGILGESVRLNCLVAEGAAPSAGAPAGAPATPNSARRDAAPPGAGGGDIDPTLRSVLDPFDGELI